MNIANFKLMHAVIGNAPATICVMATASIAVARTFSGIGAPSATTLAAGNGRYNAASSGFVVDVALVNAGSGYAVGDVIKDGGNGTGMPVQITISSVNGSGAITGWYVSTAGNYSAYPTNPVATTVVSSSGTGATVTINLPQPDYYLDITTLTAPVLYVCTASGTNSTSTWAKISGGGGGNYAGTYSNASAYSAGQIVRVQSSAAVGGVTPTIGVYGCINSVPGSGTGNQVPQYPEPGSGTVYWQLIAFGAQEVGVCTGTSQNAYINASAPF
jgi:hypothetical protein